jgi:nucleoside-diphosphate-sugar epimerase
MNEILITGGAGFFGGILKERLLATGHRCISIDLQPDACEHPDLVTVRGDIRDRGTVERIFSEHRINTVFHCAAILAHGNHDKGFLWSCNVEGSRVVADLARHHKAERLVYTSSNCLWGRSYDHPISEDEPPEPVELYGRSKLEAERILQTYRTDFAVLSLRCPTIMDAGRLGLLAILYEFIYEGKRVWVVGDGTNRYQFIYAQDLAEACLRLLSYDQSDVFNIGSDDVKSMREIYQYVIDRVGSRSRVFSLPKKTAILAMKLAYHLGISPLGPYHYKMIAEDFLFNTSHIKKTIGWQPTLTNEQMLFNAYEYYSANREEISNRREVSDHRKPASMGVIRLLKWLS